MLVLMLKLVLVLMLMLARVLLLVVQVLVVQMLSQTLKRMPKRNHQIKSNWHPYSDGGRAWNRRRRQLPRRAQT